MSKQIRIIDNLFVLTFLYDPRIVNGMKSLDGRQWHSQGKYWTASITKMNTMKLRDMGFPIPAEALSLWEDNRKRRIIRRASSIDLTALAKEIDWSIFEYELRQFQKEGVAWLEYKQGRGLLADEPRLGKTIQTVAWLKINPDIRPVIVVTTATGKPIWLQEVKKWLPEDNAVAISGGQVEGKKIDADIIILNYDILAAKQVCPACKGMKKICKVTCTICKGKGYSTTLRKDLPKPKVAVLDESHKCKENSAQRTKAAKQLGKMAPHLICLTGTPILNRPVEIYNAVNLIQPSLFPSSWNFKERYCGLKFNGFGYSYDGSTNTEELHELLKQNVMLRRLKQDVFEQLPLEESIFVPIELTNLKEYQKAEADFINWLYDRKEFDKAERAKNAEHLVRLSGLKKLSVEGKLKNAIDWLHDYLESDEKLVVFAWHQIAIEAFMKEFKRVAVRLDGSTSPAEKQKSIYTFQNDPKIKLFFGNIVSAGEAIPLHASNNVAFFELGRTPGEMKQAKDRIFNNEKAGTVKKIGIYYLMALDSIEMELAQMLDKKSKILDAVLDGKQTSSDNLLLGILKRRYHKT